MASLDQNLEQAKQFLGAMSLKQRLLMAGAAVLTAAVLFMFVNLINKPDYKPLMTGMEPGDGQALAAKLAAQSIPFQISDDGKTVSVPADKLDASRMQVAEDGAPRSGRLGFELFDKTNWGQTEFDEKVNYQRALEGELERSIRSLRDVESVRVHLVLPNDSVFLDRERPAKASVVLKLRSGRLSQETQKGIARLVAGAVDELAPDNVTVIDSDTNRPLSAANGDSMSSNDGLEHELTARLLRTLEPIVGNDGVRASVNVELDPSSSEENAETYDPKSAVAVSTQHSEEQAGGAVSRGVPGTSSNVPGGNGTKPPVETGGDESQISKSESSTYVVNKIVRRTLEPAGRIRRISAALLIDDGVDVIQENGKVKENRRKRTPEELKQLEDLAKAAIGLDTARGDLITLQNLSFEHQSADMPPKPTVTERLRVTLNDWSTVLRYATLILLFLLAYALLLRPFKKQLVKAFRELPNGTVAASQPSELVAADDMSPLSPEQQRGVVLKKQLAEKVRTEPVAAGKLIQAWLHEGKP